MLAGGGDTVKLDSLGRIQPWHTKDTHTEAGKEDEEK
jgi:hypothetical protein